MVRVVFEYGTNGKTSRVYGPFSSVMLDGRYMVPVLPGGKTLEDFAYYCYNDMWMLGRNTDEPEEEYCGVEFYHS